ncbi:MAG: FMN-binding protein [Clostridia bacterium]|nr:FMN-binding protein [Clostridia bacterium]
MNKIFKKIKSFYKANSEIITPTAVLAIICIVVTLALSSANLLTYKKIDALAKETQEKAMAKVMSGEYEEITEGIGDDEVTYNVVRNDGVVIGYIFTTSAKGYGGEILVMTAVKTDLTVAAVEILDASGETPGLGQNVTKADWYKQFATRTNDISVVKSGANSEKNEVDAVTGATISSKAVTSAVNQALDYAKEIMSKGAES